MSSSTPKRLSSALATLGVGFVVCALGCGPFGYLKKVPMDAGRAVARAEKAGAKKYAPYEYWGAVTYLEQAKLMMAYSEYERSFDYGARAAGLAQEAERAAVRREAEARAKGAGAKPAGDAAADETDDAAADETDDAAADDDPGDHDGAAEVGP